MKALKIISIILISLGVLLFTSGLLLKVMHWPDIFHGIISGIVFFVLGTALLVFSYLKRAQN